MRTSGYELLATPMTPAFRVRGEWEMAVPVPMVATVAKESVLAATEGYTVGVRDAFSAPLFSE